MSLDLPPHVWLIVAAYLLLPAVPLVFLWLSLRADHEPPAGGGE